jgi:endonuclease-3
VVKKSLQGCYGLMSDAQLRKVYDLLAAGIVPKSELLYASPYQLLVAVVLSAQATDKSVNAATAELFQVAGTPAEMLTLGVEGLLPFIRRIGLANTKAKNVVALSKMLLDEHGGEVPHDRDALQRLPGVGRKSANVVLNVAFGEPTIAVDTHVFRVANRTGLAGGKTPEQVETALMARVPERWRHHAHHWLILHGRYVCKARRPLCERCIVSDVCRYPKKSPPSAD